MSGECCYCGADHWFSYEDAVFCVECLSPESLPAVDYSSYLALTAAEHALNRKRFTEGSEPGQYETPEYYDQMRRAQRHAEFRPDYPPFWRA